jgi:hypothetical protein
MMVEATVLSSPNRCDSKRALVNDQSFHNVLIETSPIQRKQSKLLGKGLPKHGRRVFWLWSKIIRWVKEDGFTLNIRFAT